MSDEMREGGCACGAVRFRVAGPGTNRCWCHCQSCRMAAGAPCVAWATFPSEGFAVVRGELTEHRSSPQVVRSFCGRCGTALGYRHEARPAELDLAVVAFDRAAELAPECHIWVSDKLPWVHLDDGLPRHAGWPRRD